MKINEATNQNCAVVASYLYRFDVMYHITNPECHEVPQVISPRSVCVSQDSMNQSVKR